ncbi:YCII domain-containing protein [Fusarium keratoplasticum]|uniref:YCII domain-containing protein n=1 Tax=Fusarium keratoplasticum TaxID=1328300 RepID=A0ACC0QEE8_9HYPO|nr:YCII domain-containing protein [Fusarium keratoplasticum]KAI8649287.1 YCII domain-containing protein [Fusarium keratoplasticum]
MSTSALRSILRPSVASRVSAYGRRTMATGATKKEWLAIMPDKANVLEIRKKVKPIHYEGIKPLIASGALPAGGAIFEKHPVDGEPAQFKGSVVVYSAETAEQVREIIENDVYATSGVWDLEKVQILPYVAAVREPLTK